MKEVRPNCRLRGCRRTSKNCALRVSYPLRLGKAEVATCPARAKALSVREITQSTRTHSHDAAHRYSSDRGTQSSQPAHAHSRSVFDGPASVSRAGHAPGRP